MSLDDAVKLALKHANADSKQYPVLAFESEGVYYVGVSPYPEFDMDKDVGMCFLTVTNGAVSEPMSPATFAHSFYGRESARKRVAEAMKHSKYYKNGVLSK